MCEFFLDDVQTCHATCPWHSKSILQRSTIKLTISFWKCTQFAQKYSSIRWNCCRCSIDSCHSHIDYLKRLKFAEQLTYIYFGYNRYNYGFFFIFQPNDGSLNALSAIMCAKIEEKIRQSIGIRSSLIGFHCYQS